MTAWAVREWCVANHSFVATHSQQSKQEERVVSMQPVLKASYHSSSSLWAVGCVASGRK